jgi:predicted transcriptional regulator
MANISTRIDTETTNKLERLAKATSRSKSFLVAQAIHCYIDEQLWQIEAIEEGIREADAGNFADDAQVKEAFGRWGVHAS